MPCISIDEVPTRCELLTGTVVPTLKHLTVSALGVDREARGRAVGPPVRPRMKGCKMIQCRRPGCEPDRVVKMVVSALNALAALLNALRGFH